MLREGREGSLPQVARRLAALTSDKTLVYASFDTALLALNQINDWCEDTTSRIGGRGLASLCCRLRKGHAHAALLHSIRRGRRLRRRRRMCRRRSFRWRGMSRRVRMAARFGLRSEARITAGTRVAGMLSPIPIACSQRGVSRPRRILRSREQRPTTATSRGTAADPFVPGRFLIATANGIVEYVDGGKTFRGTLPGSVGLGYALAFDRHRRGVIATLSRDREDICISHDGGAHWSVLPGGLRVPTGTTHRLILDRGRLFIHTRGSGVWMRKVK